MPASLNDLNESLQRLYTAATHVSCLIHPSMNPRTVGLEQSIWRDLPEDTFRSHLVQLEERTNAVPADAQQFPESIPLFARDTDAYTFPLHDELKLADAFAFIAAVQEGAQSVAAVCLEENAQDRTLTVRFAAVDAINESLQQALRTVCEILGDAAEQVTDSHKQLEKLFLFVTRLHVQRLLGRLRSSKWEKPKYLSRTHKKPLWQDFANLIHRVQFLYTKNEKTVRHLVESQLRSLAELYSTFEPIPSNSEQEFSLLTHLIRTSYDHCTSEVLQAYGYRLAVAGQTNQVRAAVKTLRQIEKIAAYYRVSNTLIRASRRYPCYFLRQHLRLVYLPPYASIPTSVGYEDWAKTCHIHAEVQLVVHYDLNWLLNTRIASTETAQTKVLPPRVIGTSKYLCFLCYLFIKTHGRFLPTNTHGRLYDQWTIPDLAEFSDKQRERYRDVIMRMDDVVVSRAANPPLWRAEPMTSRENLLDAVRDESSIALWRTLQSETQ
ncbi:hypothetical protein LTR72_006064 [Exophiala xenobiotica]|nr:hypothetical protein LTR72_006064 [Exophiala xenobiotica]KAK5294844.1 hypothetical protein LTR14_004012 [Exophiala xenobiotica]